MILKEELWGNIPLLHIVEEQYLDKEVPVVVFFHGFGSAKDQNLHFAYNFAKKGLRVLLPDAHLHGVRAEELDEFELGLRFWEIVLTSIEELDILKKELGTRQLLTNGKIGVSGTSMGGITSLGALTTYKWIDAAAIMMGSPGFVEFAKLQIETFESQGFEIPLTAEDKELIFENLATLDVTKNPLSLNKRPLHFWHGQKDVVVPFKPTWDFYKSIKADYKDVPERLTFTIDKQAGHVVNRTAMLEATEKLASYLNE